MADDVLCPRCEEYRDLVRAEQEGAEAAEKNEPPESCPYEPVSVTMRAMWLVGHGGVTRRRRTEQAAAVMTWSTTILENALELSRGYGHDEISARIKMVLEKVAPFVEG